MNREELEKDYVRRWGNAQKCSSCGFVLAYGPYSNKQICCGKEMELVKKE